MMDRSDDGPGTDLRLRWRSGAVPTFVGGSEEDPLGISETGIVVRELLVTNWGPPEASPRQVLEVGGLEIDVSARSVRLRESPLPLTALEFGLLRTLASWAGCMLDRRLLHREVWGITAEIVSRRLDSLVTRLRRKIRGASVAIRTVHGVGYRLDPVEPGQGDPNRPKPKLL
jgi:DNA-binding response OmpR family regulator